MSITRVACDQCGLPATHIRNGDRAVTSFDAEDCAVRCAKGRAAMEAGEPVMACVLTCEHLIAALPPLRPTPPRR